MSKYEVRAAAIKAAADAMGWSVRWTRQGSRIYLRVSIGNWHPGTGGFVTVTNWVQEWYPGAIMTSWGSRGGTYVVCDIWQVLKTTA